MQRALMERVLETLLEVETLTRNERTRVQDGLAFIRSDVTETSTEMTNATPYLETFSDLSALISVRYAHQSEEEAKSVRIMRAQTQGPNYHSNQSGPHNGSEEEGDQLHPHRPPAVASHDSQRRHLAKQINEIIKASTAVSTGDSTGLGRRARWSTDKLAAGSMPTLTHPDGGIATATGNAANAQLAAGQTAQMVSASESQSCLQLTLDPFFTGREKTRQCIQNAQGCRLLGNSQSLRIQSHQQQVLRLCCA